MRILITNDDGVYSPGIAALAEVASAFGEVRIVAPDVERSSAGHSITASRPLDYKRTPLKGVEAFRVDGTPADCVALGTYHWDKVDIVLSGINLGSNLGNGLWHSGTLAGAKQAVLMGLRGIALSTPSTETEPDFETLKPWVRKVLELLLPAGDLPLINVNLPAQGTPEEGLKMLNEIVIPQARAQEGFQSGTWMNDHGNGMGVVVFDTEEHANAAQKNLRPPAGTPTTFVSSSVYEVVAQAQA